MWIAIYAGIYSISTSTIYNLILPLSISEYYWHAVKYGKVLNSYCNDEGV